MIFWKCEFCEKQTVKERRSFERRSERRSQNGERERERRSEKNWWARARAALKKLVSAGYERRSYFFRIFSRKIGGFEPCKPSKLWTFLLAALAILKVFSISYCSDKRFSFIDLRKGSRGETFNFYPNFVSARWAALISAVSASASGAQWEKSERERERRSKIWKWARARAALKK